METSYIKASQIDKKWFVVDASDKTLGRLSSRVVQILRGKNKVHYTPNQDCGDNLIIINTDKIALTGKKASDKIYFKHTGYPGGIKKTNPIKIKEKNKSIDLIKLAIKRMIPSGPLGRKQLSNCKIYPGAEHKHLAQNPKKLDLTSLNRKNLLI